TNISGSVFGAIATGVGDETLSVSGTGIVSSKDVSAGVQALNVDDLVLVDGDRGGKASNYTLAGGNHTAEIIAKTIDLSGSREYDGTTVISGGIFGSVATGIGGETLTVSGTGSVA